MSGEHNWQFDLITYMREGELDAAARADAWQSEIMFPARTRDRLDWATVDRLVPMNKDFRAFVKDVHDTATTGRAWGSFDSALTPDQHDSYVRRTSVSLLLPED